MSKFAQEIFDKYPFLSLVSSGGNEYVGIIQNQDDTVLSIYDFNRINDDKLKETFLSLGEIWWWESNRMIPINIFLKREWVFSHTLQTFNIKDCELMLGSTVSISEMARKRGKRRNIQLVRKVN